jgi:hypothetical protein
MDKDLTMRSDRYLALTATQHRQLRDALQERRRHTLKQSGGGVHSGRGMFEQQDMPQGLQHVRIYVRKHGDKPGYYTSLAAMAGESRSQVGGAAGSALDRIGDAALGASGVLGGVAGLTAATGIGVPAAIAEGGLAAGLGAVGSVAKGADMLVDVFR